MTEAYRPDIDGMRAISVLAVILYHIGVPGLGGGFVGVDVFFVISGFLVTRQLLEHRERRLAEALGDFYLRRARRILPALLVMLALLAPIMYWLMFPTDLKYNARALALGVAFAGNIGAWQLGDYFLAGDVQNPLQHLWSLGVEEQFYLAFPLVLLALRQLPARRLGALLAIAALASFIACLWIQQRDRHIAFYFTPFRGWELLCGAVLASGWLALPRHSLVRELLAVAGLALLALALTGNAPYWQPWKHSLLPTVGAMLLIHSSRDAPTRTARLLSLRPLVFVGLISYSLYLWHLPAFVLTRYYRIFPLTPGQSVAVLAAVFVAAALSWKFIEQPVRRRRVLASPRALLAAAAGVMAPLIVFGAVSWRHDGLPLRFSPEVRAIVLNPRRVDPSADACMRLPIEGIARGELCELHAEPPGAPLAVVWGDSHSRALYPAFRTLAERHHVQLYAAVSSSCRPLFGIAGLRDNAAFTARCERFNRGMLEALHVRQPQLVILAAFWMSATRDFAVTGAPQLKSLDARFSAALDTTLGHVAAPGRSICVVRGVPHYDYPVPYALASARLRGRDPQSLRLSAAAARAQYAAMEPGLERLRAGGRLRAVDPKDALCDGEYCRLVSPQGRVLYADGNHLSVDGAEFVTDTLEGCFDAPAERPGAQ
jgi:peptidoglycan/LPS O-acetylase OafA/YrhL